MKLVEGFWHVVWNVCVKGVLVIVPLELDAHTQLSFPINCDVVVLLEGFDEMFGVCVTCELYANIINNKSKGDRTPHVPSQSWRELNRIIS